MSVTREQRRTYEAKYREKHRDEIRERRKRYRVQRRKISQNFRKRIRQDVISAYGGQCVCCGESGLAFLTLDHVNSDGNVHRKEIGVGYNLYVWAMKNSYPDRLQVLCWNCNMAKFHKGVCPHQD